MKISPIPETKSSSFATTAGPKLIIAGTPTDHAFSDSAVIPVDHPLPKRILLIEENAGLCQFISQYLSDRGYAVECEGRGWEGLAHALSGEQAIVIVSVTLPGLNGIEVLRHLRVLSRIPVLMLTTKGDEHDRIMGLEMGADDCLPKPFNPRELCARVEAILRRSAFSELESKRKDPRYVVVEDVTLDNSARVAHVSGRKLALTTTEYDLFKALLVSAGRVLSREDMVQMVLGRDFSPTDRSIDTHVSHLRKKLGPRPDGMERIKCVRGVGYLYILSSPSERDTECIPRLHSLQKLAEDASLVETQ